MADVKTTARDLPSSTTLASQDTEATLAPPSEGMTKYNMYYTTSRTNMTVHEGGASTPALYYLKSSFSFRGCLLHLRRGETKASPTIAFARLPMTSRHMQVGRGDGSRDGAGDESTAEELHRDRNLLVRSDYHFATSEGDDLGKKAEFDWRKDKRRIGTTMYDCFDKDGKMVARMLSGGNLNWRKGAEMEIAEDVGEGLREMLFVSGLGIWAMEGLNYKSMFQGYSSGDKKE